MEEWPKPNDVRKHQDYLAGSAILIFNDGYGFFHFLLEKETNKIPKYKHYERFSLPYINFCLLISFSSKYKTGENSFFPAWKSFILRFINRVLSDNFSRKDRWQGQSMEYPIMPH